MRAAAAIACPALRRADGAGHFQAGERSGDLQPAVAGPGRRRGRRLPGPWICSFAPIAGSSGTAPLSLRAWPMRPATRTRCISRPASRPLPQSWRPGLWRGTGWRAKHCDRDRLRRRLYAGSAGAKTGWPRPPVSILRWRARRLPSPPAIMLKLSANTSRSGQLDRPFDAILCRHVLEHLDDPLALLSDIRRASGSRGVPVYFEVPNAGWMLETVSMWDVIYEHVGYWSAPALTALFRRAGFDPVSVCTGYGGQFLMAEAVPARPQPDYLDPGAAQVCASAPGLRAGGGCGIAAVAQQTAGPQRQHRHLGRRVEGDHLCQCPGGGGGRAGGLCRSEHPPSTSGLRPGSPCRSLHRSSWPASAPPWC